SFGYAHNGDAAERTDRQRQRPVQSDAERRWRHWDLHGEYACCETPADPSRGPCEEFRAAEPCVSAGVCRGSRRDITVEWAGCGRSESVWAAAGHPRSAVSGVLVCRCVSLSRDRVLRLRRHGVVHEERAGAEGRGCHGALTSALAQNLSSCFCFFCRASSGIFRKSTNGVMASSRATSSLKSFGVVAIFGSSLVASR